MLRFLDSPSKRSRGSRKLFTLGTLVLNVLATKKTVEIVFHGLNPEDPERKIAAFREIASSAPTGIAMQFELGESGAGARLIELFPMAHGTRRRISRRPQPGTFILGSPTYFASRFSPLRAQPQPQPTMSPRKAPS